MQGQSYDDLQVAGVAGAHTLLRFLSRSRALLFLFVDYAVSSNSTFPFQ